MRHPPRGVADTLDGTNSPPGAMSSLSNLIPDPSTPFCFQCRPAAVALTTFPAFSSPGVVSVAYQLGTRIYGLIATARNTGHDEPFVYDIPSATFITVSGVTSGNTPVTQASAGAWTPPTMTLVSTKILVTHPGFPGSGTNFGWFDISTLASPAWSAGNTATNALPSVPVGVQQFGNRAYFSMSNGQVWFSDVLVPTTITNASNVLQVGDNTAPTAMAALGLITTSGGIVQGLVVFKNTTVWQVTGDVATTNLSLNNLSPAAGTLAPRSIANTPLGVLFMSNDGIRMVTLTGSVTEPLDGVTMPFRNVSIPSRVVAAYNAGVYRICVQNSQAIGAPYQDWWYDQPKGIWTGPHTFRYDVAVAYNSTFILFSNATGATRTLWQSDPWQVLTSSFTENGVQLTWTYQTAPLADLGRLTANSAIETTINVAFGSGMTSFTGTNWDAFTWGNTRWYGITTFSPTQQLSVVASDESGAVLSQAILTSSSSGTLWDSFNWGGSKWGSSISGLRPYSIPWTKPLVFTKLVILATGGSAPGLKVSNLQVLYQPLNYVP